MLLSSTLTSPSPSGSFGSRSHSSEMPLLLQSSPIARIDVPHIPDAVAVAVGLVPVEEDAPVDVSAGPVALCVVVRVAASPVAEVWGVGGGG